MAFLKGDSLKRFLQGAVLGGIATVALGFGAGGWVLGETAAKQAADGAQKAVVAVLAPICVNKFQQDANAATNMESLKNESSYKRASFIEDGGWSVFPGNDKSQSGVAKACANMLNNL